jgi:hypothetical protein
MQMDPLRLGDEPEEIAPVDGWGVDLPSPQWSVWVRILVVVDNEMTLGFGDGDEFGLGMVLDTLRDRSFAWWVRFVVDVGWRGLPRSGQPDDLGGGTNFGQPPLFNLQYFNFQFTQAGFDLDVYDEVWFFGYNPEGAGPITPLDDPELKLVADWMDRGGGVLGTGDHERLGADLCSRIPRVRTMRKWRILEDGAPTQDGSTRNETYAPWFGHGFPEAEGDFAPQPIEPVYRIAGGLPLRWDRVPHPLLCGAEGVIEEFPDHMHEGEVFEDDQVDFNRELDIPGYEGREYPPSRPQVLARVLNLPGVDPLPRPVPHVIAHGYTTHEVRKRFALLGVYEGDPAGVGRVVVDSTWHHWLSMNLYGFRHTRPRVYRLMQTFFRNVALWLARPQQRAEMLYAAVWGALVGSSPMTFRREQSLWRVGELALDVIGRTAPQCIVHALGTVELHPEVVEAFYAPLDTDWSEPRPWILSQDVFNRAIVGGIGSTLLQPSLRFRDALARRERPQLDGRALGHEAAAGVEAGYRAFVDAAVATPEVLAELREGLTKGFRVLPVPPPAPFSAMTIRIVAERLQVSDPSDPLLIDGYFTLTVRARVDESVIASAVIERMEVPESGPRGVVVPLDLELAPFDVIEGDRLIVEVLAGQEEVIGPGAQPARASDRVEGRPADWLGSHLSNTAEPWRLWYRIERIETTR